MMIDFKTKTKLDDDVNEIHDMLIGYMRESDASLILEKINNALNFAYRSGHHSEDSKDFEVAAFGI